MTDQEILEKLLEIAWANGFQFWAQWNFHSYERPTGQCVFKYGKDYRSSDISTIFFYNPKDGVGFVEGLCRGKYKESNPMFLREGLDGFWHQGDETSYYLPRLAVAKDSERLAYLAKEFLE